MADPRLSIAPDKTSAMTIVMVIDGHDWRYIGGGLKWEVPEGRAAIWADLKKQPYSGKECMICGFVGSPADKARPCHEIWADRTGRASSAGLGSEVYYPVCEAAA